ncbi:somatostatin receptor type 2-like [Parasteatoda tepidariorum]|uniref:somatostatin receptor type 2-like n=1 Tax=Parasteatoda tepidariorum TaxID=114398 RepID=UPI00077F821D|nr:somatostatin receptor type 2-like [Parasteatoda tepidariorum]
MTEFGDVAFLIYNISLNCTHLFPFLLPNETNCTFPDPPEDRFMFFSPPEWLVQFARISYGLVGLLGLCGNSLVIYVVLRFSKMQTVTNMYILNLAFADEMYLIGLPFLLTTMIYHSWPFGRAMCKIYMTTTSINQFTSSLLLTVMSADRYMAVCHPIQSPRYRTPFIAKFICLTAWTISALLMVPIYMYASILNAGDYINCNIYWPESSYMNGEKAFTLYAFTLGFAAPLLFIIVFYFLVICKLRKVGPKNKSKEKKKTHRKVTYLVLTVITVYILCWLPYWSAQLWLTFIPPDSGQNTFTFTMMLLTQCLSYANSAVNPILYAFLSDNFKKSFAKAFTCASRREVNAQLHVENSVFPKTKSGSSRQGERKSDTPRVLKVDRHEMEQSTGITVMKSEKDVSGLKNGFNVAAETTQATQV